MRTTAGPTLSYGINDEAIAELQAGPDARRFAHLGWLGRLNPLLTSLGSCSCSLPAENRVLPGRPASHGEKRPLTVGWGKVMAGGGGQELEKTAGWRRSFAGYLPIFGHCVHDGEVQGVRRKLWRQVQEALHRQSQQRAHLRKPGPAGARCLSDSGEDACFLEAPQTALACGWLRKNYLTTIEGGWPPSWPAKHLRGGPGQAVVPPRIWGRRRRCRWRWSCGGKPPCMLLVVRLRPSMHAGPATAGGKRPAVPLLLNPRYVFNRFVVGPNSRMGPPPPRWRCRSTGASVQSPFLCVVGPWVKTHLMQADRPLRVEIDPDARGVLRPPPEVDSPTT